MTEKAVKLVICDIFNLVNGLVPVIKKTLTENNIHYHGSVDKIVDYCIFRAISDVFLVPVINTEGNYTYEIIYSQVKNRLQLMLTQVVRFSDLKIFNGEEVKAITNGRSLFITNFLRYD